MFWLGFLIGGWIGVLAGFFVALFLRNLPNEDED
tara:strand:- start:236 stop:337 length:102 start_codon:yes stop_codon:yes gene_type:complete